jgi:hypothetical protein
MGCKSNANVSAIGRLIFLIFILCIGIIVLTLAQKQHALSANEWRGAVPRFLVVRRNLLRVVAGQRSDGDCRNHITLPSFMQGIGLKRRFGGAAGAVCTIDSRRGGQGDV